ncbi:hypothetical protein [Tenacibaculum sp. 190524A02b]|uniref:Uncharacterized protein n=1 Tax=Tenacibaculum vairaonense TaxID=3137860 RepID=A0ABP1FFG6_9FLAO
MFNSSKKQILKERILATIINNSKDYRLISLTNRPLETLPYHLNNNTISDPITNEVHVVFHKANGEILSIEKF